MFKHIVIGYFVVTSIIAHLVALVAFAAIAALVPAIKEGFDFNQNFANAPGSNQETGVVKDVSTLRQGEHSYVGYAIDYKGQTLYVQGDPDAPAAAGDEVDVMMMKPPFGPSKRLMVVVVEQPTPPAAPAAPTAPAGSDEPLETTDGDEATAAPPDADAAEVVTEVEPSDGRLDAEAVDRSQAPDAEAAAEPEVAEPAAAP